MYKPEITIKILKEGPIYKATGAYNGSEISTVAHDKEEFLNNIVRAVNLTMFMYGYFYTLDEIILTTDFVN